MISDVEALSPSIWSLTERLRPDNLNYSENVLLFEWNLTSAEGMEAYARDGVEKYLIQGVSRE